MIRKLNGGDVPIAWKNLFLGTGRKEDEMIAELRELYEKQEQSLKVLRDAAAIYHRMLQTEQENLPVEIQKSAKIHTENVLQAVNVFEFWWRRSFMNLNLVKTTQKGG